MADTTTDLPVLKQRSATFADGANNVVGFKRQETATEREENKTPEERGEDAVYIINHAAACTTLDTLNTPVELWTKRHLGIKLSTSFCPSCQSGDHKEGAHSFDIATDAGRWLVAEYVGDWVGAIPTLMVQRHAPFVMEGIGRVLTYAAGDYFYAGAKKDAEQWGDEHGFTNDSEEVKGRTREIYNHEMKHIAQAFVWTGFSTGITLGTLKALGDDTDVKVNLASKLAGVSLSFFGVLGARAAFPDNARQWDKWASEHIATPITRVVSNTLGIEGKVVDDVLQQRADYASGAQWLK